MDNKGEIRWLGDLQRIRPEPGDVFVMMYDGMLTPQQRDTLMQQWLAGPLGHWPMTFIEGGVRLGVMGKPE